MKLAKELCYGLLGLVLVVFGYPILLIGGFAALAIICTIVIIVALYGIITGKFK